MHTAEEYITKRSKRRGKPPRGKGMKNKTITIGQEKLSLIPYRGWNEWVTKLFQLVILYTIAFNSDVSIVCDV